MPRDYSYNPSKAEEGRVRDTTDVMLELKRQKEPHVKEADESERRFRMDVSNREGYIEDWQSNISIGYAFSVVHAQLAMMANNELGWELFPENRRAAAVKEVFDDLLENTAYRNRFSMRSPDQILEALVYGTGPAQVYYKHETRTVKQELVANTIDEYRDMFKKKQWDEKDATVWKGMTYEPFSFYDYYTDVNTVYLEDATRVIRRYVMTLDEFKRVYKNYPSAKYVKASGDTEYPEFYQRQTDIQDDHVEVLWYWNVGTDVLSIVANGTVELAYMPVLYKDEQGKKMLPFCVMNNSLLPRVHYGRPEPIILKDLEDELNTLHNMMIDKSKLDIFKPLLSEEEFDEDEFYNLAPRSIIPVVNANSVKELNIKGDFSEVRYMIDQLEKSAYKLTGISENAMSAISGKTATETAILKDTVESRMKFKIKRMENQAIARVGRIWVEGFKQFMTVPEIKKITGEEEMEEYMSMIMDRFPELADFENETVEVYPTVTGKDKEGNKFNYVAMPEFLKGASFRVEGKTSAAENRFAELDKMNNAANILLHPQVSPLIDWPAFADNYRKTADLPADILKQGERERERQIVLAKRTAESIEQGVNVPVPNGIGPTYILQLTRYFNGLGSNGEEFSLETVQLAQQHILQAQQYLGAEQSAQGVTANPSAPGLAGQALQNPQQPPSNMGGFA